MLADLERAFQSDLFEAIRARHTVWHFSPQVVERKKIDAILEAARWAPSGANSQPWDFVVVDDEALRPKMIELLKLAHTRWMTEAMPVPRPEAAINVTHGWVDEYCGEPAVFIFCGLCFKQHLDSAKHAKPEYIYRMNHQSLGAAMENLMLAATALGLGTHWVGCAELVKRELQEVLGIPERVEIVAAIVLGYPRDDSNVRAGQPVRRARQPLEEVVHFNKW